MLSDDKINKICQVTHVYTGILQKANGEEQSPPWDEAPEWQHKDSEASVRHILDNPDMTARGEHERWCRAKREAGWTYGPVRDNTKKIHPQLKDYDELDLANRLKDERIEIVRVLARILAD